MTMLTADQTNYQARPSMNPQLDAIDRAILDALVENARIPVAELARRVGLSKTPVALRIRAMEEIGLITGYRATIDPDSAGLPLAAYISIAPLDPTEPDDIPDRLRDVSAIEACHSVAGDMSYLLKVRVATPHELEELIALVRSRGNVSTRTTVVLSTSWEGRSASGGGMPDRSADDPAAATATAGTSSGDRDDVSGRSEP